MGEYCTVKGDEERRGNGVKFRSLIEAQIARGPGVQEASVYIPELRSILGGTWIERTDISTEKFTFIWVDFSSGGKETRWIFIVDSRAHCAHLLQ